MFIKALLDRVATYWYELYVKIINNLSVDKVYKKALET